MLFFLFPLGLLILLLCTALVHIKHLADTIIEGLFVQARVIFEVDGHERAETGHLEVVDTVVAYHFFDEDVEGKLLRSILGLRLRLLFFAFFGNGVIVSIGRVLFRGGSFEHIKCDDLALDQGLVDDVLVASGGILEVDMGLSLVILVGLVVVRILNSLLWRFKLANIDGCGIGELLKVGGEALEHVGQVVLLLDGLSELVNLILTFSRGSLVSLALLLFFVQTLLVALLVAFHLFLILLLVLGSALNLCVVQQPLSKEVNGVLRISPVHDSHAL